MKNLMRFFEEDEFMDDVDELDAVDMVDTEPLDDDEPEELDEPQPGLKFNSGDDFNTWVERVGAEHKRVLKSILPSYRVLDTIPQYNREVQTFVYGSMLGIGVLTTVKTGESFMYFVERSRVPMGYTTCSNWLRRFNLPLAIRDAYRMTMFALKRGVFRRCNIAQYRKGTGKIRRTEN